MPYGGSQGPTKAVQMRCVCPCMSECSDTWKAGRTSRSLRTVLVRLSPGRVRFTHKASSGHICGDPSPYCRLFSLIVLLIVTALSTQDCAQDGTPSHSSTHAHGCTTPWVTTADGLMRDFMYICIWCLCPETCTFLPQNSTQTIQTGAVNQDFVAKHVSYGTAARNTVGRGISRPDSSW